jgi:hypothetical protein
MKRYWRALPLVLLLGISHIAAEENIAIAKLAAKIEKVIINQILRDLKETDYDSYVLLSAMWQGIKNQSDASVERSLQQLLVEKGFVYTLYTHGYRYSEPGMALTFFAEDFFGTVASEEKEYLTMMADRYNYMIRAAQIANQYFIPDSFYHTRTMLNTVKHRSKNKDDLDFTAKFMADELLAHNYLPFKNRSLLEDPAQKAAFVAALREYLGANKSQRDAYRKFNETGQHKTFSQKVKNNVSASAYTAWIQKYSSEAQLKEIYLELVTYTTRVMLSGDQEFSVDAHSGRFPAMRALLSRVHPETKFAGDSIPKLQAGLLAQLQTVSREKQTAKYLSLAAAYTFLNTMVEQAHLAVGLYQEKGSLYEALENRHGRHFKRYLVVPWYRNFYREDWFGNVFLAEDDSYRDFFGKMQITAQMTDYILSRDDQKLVKNFKKFAWLSLSQAEASKNREAGFARMLDKARRVSEKAGLTQQDEQLIDTAFAYSMGMTSLSEVMLTTKKYMTRVARTDRYSPEAQRSVEQSFDSGALRSAPFVQGFYLKVVAAMAPSGDLGKLKAELANLNQPLLAEILSWRDDGAFALYDAKLKYELPTLGTPMRSFLALLEANDTKSIRGTVLTAYNILLDKSMVNMPDKAKYVTEPFVRSAMNSLLLGQKVGRAEYTNVAFESMKGVERNNFWLHFSLGVAVGQFTSTSFSGSANKVYLNDMIGVDFLGLGYQMAGADRRPWFGMGIFAGGILDFMVSETAKLETRNLAGGSNYLKTGLFFDFRHPDNSFVHFGIQIGAAFSLSGEPVYFAAASWNVFDVADFF